MCSVAESDERADRRYDAALLGPGTIDSEGMSHREIKRSKTTGGSEMYNKCASLRWLIVDEVSTASLYVLGIVQKDLHKAKETSDLAEDEDGVTRDWGGVNLGIFGDWLQLPAVAAKSIFRNPFLKDLPKYML